MTARACPRCGRPPESHPPQNAAKLAEENVLVTTKLLATRTMRARHPGTCAIDNCPIFVGDRIGLTPIGWARTHCIVRHNRETSTEETTRP